MSTRRRGKSKHQEEASNKKLPPFDPKKKKTENKKQRGEKETTQLARQLTVQQCDEIMWIIVETGNGEREILLAPYRITRTHNCPATGSTPQEHRKTFASIPNEMG